MNNQRQENLTASRQVGIHHQGGYIALIALLIIAAAGLTIGLAVSVSGIEELQLAHGSTQALRAKSLAGICVEDGLERLRHNWSGYSATLSIDSDFCILNTAVNGGEAIVSATGTVDIYHQKIQVQVDNNLNIISWQEE